LIWTQRNSWGRSFRYFRPIGCNDCRFPLFMPFKGSVQSEALFVVSWHVTFSRWGVLSTSPNRQAGRPPLSSVRGCLFNTFADTRHTWRLSPSAAKRTRHVVMTGSPLPWTSDYEICDMESFKRGVAVHNVAILSKALTLRSAARVLRSWVWVPLGEWLVARFLVSVLYIAFREHTMGRPSALCPLSNVCQQDWDWINPYGM